MFAANPARSCANSFSGSRGGRYHVTWRCYPLRRHRVVVAGRASGVALKARRFPPPWTVEDIGAEVQRAAFVVRDHNGQQLAYLYFEEEPGRRSAAQLLSHEEARELPGKPLSLLLSSECPPLVMPLSQSCKEKLQLQPSSAALLLPSEGGYQPEKKPLRL